MSKTIQLNINDGSSTRNLMKIDTATHKAARVVAEKDAVYELLDTTTQLPPKKLVFSRVGDDLLIFFEGSEVVHPDLVIEGYYSSNGMVAGRLGDSLQAYVPSGAQQFEAAALLPDQTTKTYVLSSQSIGVSSPFLEVGLPAVLGVAALAVLASNGKETGAPPSSQIPSPSAPVPPEPSVPPAPPSPAPPPPLSVGTLQVPQITNDSTPAISGTGATAGARLTISITDSQGNAQNLTAIVNQQGTYSATPSKALLDGAFKVNVIATDSAGQTAQISGSGLVDSTPPNSGTTTVTLAAVTADNIVNQAESTGSVVFKGAVKGEHAAGDAVTVTVNQKTYATVVDESGNFQVSISGSDLVAGVPKITVVVKVKDAAGNIGNIAAEKAYEIDVTPPKTGVLNAPDNTNDTTPTITGVGADPNISLSVVLTDSQGRQQVFSTQSDANGAYSITPTTDLPAGSYRVVAKAVDAAGNMASSEDSGSVDNIPPDDSTTKVMLGAITADNIVNQTESTGNIDLAGTVQGEYSVGDAVTVTVNQKAYATVVDANGNFQVSVPGSDLIAGTPKVSVVVKAKDAAGNVGNIVGEKTYEVDVTPPKTGTLNAPDNTYDTTPTITGVGADPGISLTVTLTDAKNQTQVFSTQADALGAYSVTPTTELPVGTYHVVAKAVDAAGNAASSEDVGTVIVDPPAVVGITVATTSKDEQGRPYVAYLPNEAGALSTVPATKEDADNATVLQYTVTLDRPRGTDLSVVVALSGTADAADIASIEGQGLNYDAAARTVTVVVPAGATSATFSVNPAVEVITTAINVESQETLVATVQSSNGGNYLVDQSQPSATGVILDGGPIRLPKLDGDLTLHYGTSSELMSAHKDYGFTVDGLAKDKNGVIYKPVLTTDYNDHLEIGRNVGAWEVNNGGFGPAATYADGSEEISTIDLGRGDDYFVIESGFASRVRAFLGEGNDQLLINGVGVGAKALDYSSYIFGEAGDDVVKLMGGGSSGSVYLGSGSDTLTWGAVTNTVRLEGSNTVIDTGSGTQANSNMPSSYQSTYIGGYAAGQSLGNDDNIDKESDVNRVEIFGYLTLGVKINGGLGSDLVDITGYVDGSHINLGDGSNVLNIGSYLSMFSSVATGAGDDVVKIGTSSSGKIVTGAGDDFVEIGGDNAESIDLGEGNDTLMIKGNASSYSRISAGDGDDVVTIQGSMSDIWSSVDLGAGNDVIRLGGGAWEVNGGSGIDKLEMIGGNKFIRAQEISSIEIFDLRGSGPNKLQGITKEWVLSQRKAGSPAILINGDADDVVDLGYNGVDLTDPDGFGQSSRPQWAPTGVTKVVDDVTYSAWSYGLNPDTIIFISPIVQVI
ncbi:MAG: Ig-like domain-containing protein [Pseudomonadota bacterium]|nr:Ig-like domain-containing protein [Pseudomonadota bacterium]